MNMQIHSIARQIKSSSGRWFIFPSLMDLRLYVAKLRRYGIILEQKVFDSPDYFVYNRNYFTIEHLLLEEVDPDMVHRMAPAFSYAFSHLDNLRLRKSCATRERVPRWFYYQDLYDFKYRVETLKMKLPQLYIPTAESVEAASAAKKIGSDLVGLTTPAGLIRLCDVNVSHRGITTIGEVVKATPSVFQATYGIDKSYFGLFCTFLNDAVTTNNYLLTQKYEL